jgi:hypothetical protein
LSSAQDCHWLPTDGRLPLTPTYRFRLEEPEDYDGAQGFRETARQTVNDWIRTSPVRRRYRLRSCRTRPAEPRQILPAFDVGDHLHLNPTGYQARADAVPAGLFRQEPLPPGFGCS